MQLAGTRLFLIPARPNLVQYNMCPCGNNTTSIASCWCCKPSSTLSGASSILGILLSSQQFLHLGVIQRICFSPALFCLLPGISGCRLCFLHGRCDHQSIICLSLHSRSYDSSLKKQGEEYKADSIPSHPTLSTGERPLHA